MDIKYVLGICVSYCNIYYIYKKSKFTFELRIVPIILTNCLCDNITLLNLWGSSNGQTHHTLLSQPYSATRTTLKYIRNIGSCPRKHQQNSKILNNK